MLPCVLAREFLLPRGHAQLSGAPYGRLQRGTSRQSTWHRRPLGLACPCSRRYSKVMEADGSINDCAAPHLDLINQALDEILAEQEGEFDAEILVWAYRLVRTGRHAAQRLLGWLRPLVQGQELQSCRAWWRMAP